MTEIGDVFALGNGDVQRGREPERLSARAAVAIPESPMAVNQYVIAQQVQIFELAKLYARAGLLPKELVGKPEAVFVILSTGMELGIGFATALRSIYINNQRPVLSADLMVGVAMAAGATFQYDADEDAAIVRWKRGGSSGTAAFGMADAKRAGLVNKDNWQKYPNQMCLARAKAAAARQAAPDRLAGLYTPDELGNEVQEQVEAVSTWAPPTLLSINDGRLPAGTGGGILASQAAAEAIEKNPVVDVSIPRTGEEALAQTALREGAKAKAGRKRDVFDEAIDERRRQYTESAIRRVTAAAQEAQRGMDAPAAASVESEQEDQPPTEDQIKRLGVEVRRTGIPFEKTGTIVRVKFPEAIWHEWGMPRVPEGEAAWVTVWQRDGAVMISAREVERALNVLSGMDAAPLQQQTALDMAERSFA